MSVHRFAGRDGIELAYREVGSGGRSDADELAALLRESRYIRLPGDHIGAVAAPELAVEIAAFLAER